MSALLPCSAHLLHLYYCAVLYARLLFSRCTCCAIVPWRRSSYRASWHVRPPRPTRKKPRNPARWTASCPFSPRWPAERSGTRRGTSPWRSPRPPPMQSLGSPPVRASCAWRTRLSWTGSAAPNKNSSAPTAPSWAPAIGTPWALWPTE